jgi:curved DNA-binding protein CbpA
MKNYYHILGVPETSPEEQVRQAFKRLAVQYHPDKHGGDPGMEERFKEINEAYQVLNNPYLRAQHDLQLQYGRMALEHVRRQQARPWDNPFQARRPYYRKPIVSNAMANLMAFGFTLLITLVFMGAYAGYRYYQRLQYEALLVERRAVFDEAKKDYHEGRIENSLIVLAGLTPFKAEESDMADYRKYVLNDIVFRGEENFNQKDFAAAIHYYDLVQRFSPYRPNQVKARMAASYRYMNQPDKSLGLLKELIEENYEVVATLVQMAEVYRFEYQNNEEALNYYELAREVARKEYVKQFGEAYPILIHPQLVPVDHYYLFTGMAELYIEMDEPEKSVQTANWIKRVWADSTSGYLLSGRGYVAMKKPRQACHDFWNARTLGYKGEIPGNCR